MLLVLSTVAFVSGIFWKSVLVIVKQDKIRQIAAQMLNDLGSAEMTVFHTIGSLISLTLLGLRSCLKYMLHISCMSAI